MSKYESQETQAAVEILESYGFEANDASGNRYARLNRTFIKGSKSAFFNKVSVQINGWSEYVTVNFTGLGIDKGRSISYTISELSVPAYKNKLHARIKRIVAKAQSIADARKSTDKKYKDAYSELRQKVQAELDKAGVIDYTIKQCYYGSSALVKVNKVELDVGTDLTTRVKIGDFHSSVPFMKAVKFAEMI